MFISGLSQPIANQAPAPPERKRSEARYAQIIELGSELGKKARQRDNRPAPPETLADSATTPPRQGLSLYYSQDLARQTQQHYEEEREHLSRIPPINSKAVQSYRQLELEEQREQVSRLMGLDVYA